MERLPTFQMGTFLFLSIESRCQEAQKSSSNELISKQMLDAIVHIGILRFPILQGECPLVKKMNRGTKITVNMQIVVILIRSSCGIVLIKFRIEVEMF